MLVRSHSPARAGKRLSPLEVALKYIDQIVIGPHQFPGLLERASTIG